jgi:DNA polymerase-3 subunit epsilon
MKNIVILDTETTGLDSSKDKTVEVAAVLYNIPSRSILAQASTLLFCEENKAEEINHIPLEALKVIPPTVEGSSLGMIISMIMEADAIVAHNAEFDKKFVQLVPPLQMLCRDARWICTRNDVVWPLRKGASLSLTSICIDLGVPVVNAHRALADCLLLVAAMEKMPDIDHFLDKSGADRQTYYAIISFEQRQLAKDHGFLWDNIKKQWHAKLTYEEALYLPFKVVTM